MTDQVGPTPTAPPATPLQKVPTPQAADACLTDGLDRVAGFVLRAADAATARTPAEVYELFGLGFPGSPHRPDGPHIDVLRFEATPQLQLEDATGGTDEAGRLRTDGLLVDRPPFTGTGFAKASSTVAPLYWLVHSRVPAGAQLWRLGADGSQTLRATYVDVATGWVLPDSSAAGLPVQPLTRHVGPVAQWRGAYFNADPLPDGTVVLASTAEIPGFAPTPARRWRHVVPRAEVTELFELTITATWNGIPVRVVGAWPTPSGEVSQLFSLAHNADIAEALRMVKLDAACYEATVPSQVLIDVVTAQRIPSSWA